MGIKLNRMTEILDGVRILAKLGVDDATRVVGGGVSWIALNDLAKGGDIPCVGGLSPRFGVNLRHMRVEAAERLTACASISAIAANPARAQMSPEVIVRQTPGRRLKACRNQRPDRCDATPKSKIPLNRSPQDRRVVKADVLRGNVSAARSSGS